MKLCEPKAVKLFHEGQLALARMEHNGVRVDRAYVLNTIKDLDEKVKEIERRMRADREVYRPWVRRFGDNANLGSHEQLASVLFDDLGFEATYLTATGKRSTGKEALDDVDHPFVDLFLKAESYKKIVSTYLVGIRTEMVEHADGLWYVHPSYGLHRAATYRSNCTNPNWQNVPTREYEIAQLVRNCYVARPGRYLVEVDFGMIEVRIGACYHHDPAMIRYCKDPKSDMHRDVATQLFFLTNEQVMQMKKTARHAAKNGFVFPEFYGSVWFNCAPNIWKEMTRGKWALPDGTPLVKHLKRNGIKELGDCNPKGEPRPGTFARHVKDIERHLWDKRFPVYRDWKRGYYDQYLRDGGFTMLTGFRVNSFLGRNDVANYPIQGSAFHCELRSIIEAQHRIDTYGMDSLLVGQVHDCDVADVTRAELQDYLDMMNEIKTDWLPKQWKWINVPLTAESEVCERGGSWATKKEWVRGENGWALKS